MARIYGHFRSSHETKAPGDLAVEAARWVQRAIAEHPPAVWGHQVLCASHMLGGQKTEARRSLDELRCWDLDLTVEQVKADFNRTFTRVCCENIADGLEAAGLPH
jgi:hypothetical protein